MKKRQVTQGTLDSLPAIISGVHQYTETNLENLLRVLVQSPGVACRLVDGVATGTNLEASIDGSDVDIGAGFAITPDYQYIYCAGGGTVIAPSDGDYIVARYANTYADSVTGLDGFVYPSGLTPSYKTINASYTFTGVSPGDYDSATELLLAHYHSAGPSVTDARASGVLQLRDSIVSELYASVDKDDIYFSGLVGASGLYIGNKILILADATEATYTITASGFKEILDIGSGIAYNGTYDRDDGQGNRTIVDEEHILPQHSTGMSGIGELEGLFRDGVIDYDDGYGMREVQAWTVPVQPGVPTSLGYTIFYHEPDQEFKSIVDAASIAFNITQADRSKILLGRSLVTELQNRTVNYMILDPVATVSGVYYSYTNTGVNSVEASGIWASVTGIVTGNYSYNSSYNTITATELGWAEPATNVTTLTDTISNASTYIGELLADASDSIQASVDAKQAEVENAASALIEENNKLAIYPSRALKSFACRLSWTAPALINNQKIKNYEVKVVQVKGSGAENKTMAQLFNIYSEQVKGVYRDHITQELRSVDKNGRYLYDARNPVLMEDYSDYPNKQIHVSGVNTSYVTAQDRVKIGTSYSRVKSFNFWGPSTAASGMVDLYISISGGTGDSVEFISEVPDDTIYGIYGTSYSFDVVPDHYYMAYTRAVNIYDYASAWTDGLFIDVRTTTASGQSSTVQQMVTADTKSQADAELAKTKAVSLDTQKQLTALEQMVTAKPSLETMINVVTAINQIANSGITGFLPYGA